MSIASEITRISSAKSAIKTAINAKGGSLTNETLDEYADAIAAISTGGPFDLVKVTAFTPAQSALTAISSIALSGMGVGEMGDYTAYNGTYNVTAATERESDPLKRVFKHSTSNYYLYWFDYLGTGYWVLASNTSATELYDVALYYSSSSALTSSTNTWYSEMGGSQSVTAAITNTTYPAVTQVLTGRNVTAYNTSTKEWTISSTDRSLTTFEKTPSVNGVWAATGTTLIGNRIAIAAGPVPTSGLVFYAPLDASHASAETGQTLNSSGTVNYADESMVIAGSGKITFDVGSSAPTGTNAVTLSIWYKGSQIDSNYSMLIGYGSTPYQATAFCFFLKNGTLMVSGNGSGSVELHASILVADNGWHHCAATINNNTAQIYQDGELVATGNSPIDIGGTDGAIGGAFWGEYSMLSGGSLKAARIYNSVLSAQDIAALSAEF